MRSTARGAALLGAATCLLLLTPGVATAAQTPDERATCLARVFQSQAVSGPRTVADRIQEIREVFLEGVPFGQVLQPLAHDDCE